jgi:CubicO group peptidase (beta-lactamase class C family)
MNKTFSRFFLSFLLLFSIFAVSLPQAAFAQVSAQTSADLQTRLAAIEQKVEARRKELGIPGMSLAIVKDGEVIFAKGFGYKDFAKQAPATADTQFAIGSVTKAFTAMSVLMSQEEGKLSIDDNPKKYLPYFKINDADIDKNITIRDLLTHSSGLAGTDLAWLTGKLTREEIIKVAGEAVPTAKLREKFQYQNVMFAAAGEIVARVQKQSWQKYAFEKILKPLGMTNSTMSVADMQKTKDFSLGYDYNAETKETRLLPTRALEEIAPAGAINSSAKDMAQWIKFILAGGELNGKRLVSEKSFAEWLKPQQKISPDGKTSYALGWGVTDRKGVKVLQHSGGIDGFNSFISVIPEKKLGYIMLTNVSESSLGNEMQQIIWQNLIEDKKVDESVKLPLKAMEKLVGKYRFEAAGFDVEVKIENENLMLIVPGQPVYSLERTGERQFKIVGAPDGFSVKFTPAQGDATEIYLQQPQGNYILPRINVDGSVTKNPTVSTDNPAKELIGKFIAEDGRGIIEIKETDGKVALVIEGQPPYEMKQKEKDVYSSPVLPDTYSLKIKRAASGKIEGIVLVQPEGEFAFKLLESAANSTPKITVDEVMTKTIAALGGEANWRKLNSREVKFDLEAPQQGIKGYGTRYAKAPNFSASNTTFTALGKSIATDFGYFDGTSGGEILSFLPPEIYTSKRIEDLKLESDFYNLLNWKSGLKSSEITGTEKVGDEEAYVVRFLPEKASDYTYYISTKTFLPLKKSSVADGASEIRVTQTFSDYRAIDGVMIPFKSVTDSPMLGDVIITVKEVKHNILIEDSVFKPKKQE